MNFSTIPVVRRNTKLFCTYKEEENRKENLLRIKNDNYR